MIIKDGKTGYKNVLMHLVDKIYTTVIKHKMEIMYYCPDKDYSKPEIMNDLTQNPLINKLAEDELERLLEKAIDKVKIRLRKNNGKIWI